MHTVFTRIGLSLSLLFTISVQADFQQIVIKEHGGANKLQFIRAPKLPAPGPEEAIVRVLTASASFTDILVRKGLYPVDATLPYAPGYDLVGVVDQIGSEVTGINVGQRVADLTIWGAYSEYTAHKAANLVPVPDGVSDEEAVSLILSYTTAYQMLHRAAAVQSGQRVLIHGASGAVGTALAQLGILLGLEMYGTASAGKQAYVRKLGVEPIDYSKDDFVEKIMTATNGEGVDVVFDAIGADNFKRSYSVLNSDGKLIVYGLYQASRNADNIGGMLLEFMSWQWQKLMWDWFPEDARQVSFYSIADLRIEKPAWFSEDLTALFTLLSGQRIEPKIWKVLPLSEAAVAHEHIENGDVRGKIVLRVSESL